MIVLGHVMNHVIGFGTPNFRVFPHGGWKFTFGCFLTGASFKMTTYCSFLSADDQQKYHECSSQIPEVQFPASMDAVFVRRCSDGNFPTMIHLLVQLVAMATLASANDWDLLFPSFTPAARSFMPALRAKLAKCPR